MKITYEVPDNTKCLSLVCLWKTEEGFSVGQHLADTGDIGDGVVLTPDWKEGENNAD